MLLIEVLFVYYWYLSPQCPLDYPSYFDEQMFRFVLQRFRNCDSLVVV
jgi:hypothetical protein